MARNPKAEEFGITENFKSLITPGDFVKFTQQTYGWDSSQVIATDYFMTNYFAPTPNKRSQLVRNYKGLMPGKIFTYQYDPLYKDELAFYDRRPIIMCIKNYYCERTKHELTVGINFNFLPKEIRTFVLELIWKSFDKIMEDDYAERQSGGGVGRQKLLFNDQFDFYGLLGYLLSTVGRTEWKFAIRQYIFQRMDNVKWVDYLDWGWIPMLKSRDLIGISERELIKLYWKRKTKTGIKHKYK